MGLKKSWYENHREINGIKERRCTACEEWFPETEEYFYMRNKSKPERGLNSECKKCAREKSLEKFYKLSPEKREEYKLKRNKEKELIRNRIWFQNNRDKKKEYMKEYYKQHPEQMKMYAERHRNHDITPNEWKSVQQYFNYSCAYCGKSLEEQYKDYKQQLHKEHVDHQGSNDITNCVCACSSCNSIKHTKTLDEFYESNDILQFTKDKYDKIIKWITEDCFQYIEDKKPKKEYNKRKKIITV